MVFKKMILFALYMTPNLKYPIHKEIIRASGDPAVVNSAAKYFEDRVIPEINQSMETDMLDRFVEIIKTDATISSTKKSELLKLANKENMAEFLSSLLLYSINKPNVLDEQISEHNNLPPQNPYFTGRADQLSKINHLLVKQGDAVNIRQTISGLGGIGKTQLAIQYAYSYGSIYKNCIWFVNAETSLLGNLHKNGFKPASFDDVVDLSDEFWIKKASIDRIYNY